MVVANNCLPFGDANAICLRELLRILKKRYEIHILTYAEREDKVVEDGMRIFGIRKSWISKSFSRSPRIVKKAIGLSICADPSFFSVSGLSELAESLLAKNSYAAVITSSGSFTPQLVGLKMKSRDPSIKWIAQFFDPLPEDNPGYRKRLNLGCRLVGKTDEVLKKADHLVFSKNLYSYYSRKKALYAEKMRIIDIPLIKEIPSIENGSRSEDYDFEESKINLVYSGSMYRRVRNPDYLFKVLKLLPNDKYRLHIIGESAVQNLVTKNELQDMVIIHGALSHEKALTFINNADILLNLGNYHDYLVPSKIFNYISTGLPIINFKSIDADSSSTYLEHYENAIDIDERLPLSINASKFDVFCSENKGIRLKFNDVERLFVENTPQYNADNLSEIIEIGNT